MQMDPRLKTDQVTPEIIQYVVEKIVSGIQPQKIILFGSHSRGDFSHHSDLDLFIIKGGNESNKAVRRQIEDLLWGRKFSLDLIVRKPEEVEWNFEAQNPFYVRHVFKEGKILYERK